MHIIIIQDNAINESMALTELVGYLEPQGHTFELFLDKEETHLEHVIQQASPELLLIPADLGNHHWSHQMAKRLKQHFPQVPIVTGGTYPTFYTETALDDPNFDFLIVGEAELALEHLLKNIDANQSTNDIPGVWCQQNGELFKNGTAPALKSLEGLPLPNREIYYKYPFIRDFKMKRFSTSRGCFHPCTFCFNPKLKEHYSSEMPYVRRKTVSQVIEEVQAVQAMAPLNSIHFSDDIFIVHPKWMNEFAERFPKEVGLRFSCNLTLSSLTPEMMDALKKAGCRGVALGIESGVPQIREKIFKKRFANKDAIERSQYLRKLGILVTTFNQFGIPTETIDDVFQTFELNRQMKASNARVNISIPLPETELASIASDLGLLASQQQQSVLELPDFAEANHRGQNKHTAHAFENLAMLFSVTYDKPWLYPLLRWIAKQPYLPFLQIFKAGLFLREKKFFEVEWFSGLRYFWHTGPPDQRSKNFTTLI